MEIKWSKRTILKVLVLLLAITVIIAYFYAQKIHPDHLRINEISFVKNNKVDWIEIYNPTMNNLLLEGLYLSDKAANFSKFRIKERIVIPSHGYVTIYCQGYQGDIRNSTVTNFRISNGETIFLVGSDGSTIIDSMTAVASEESSAEVSIGRFPDGSDDIFIMSKPTPGTRNQKDMPEQLNNKVNPPL